MAWPNDAAPLPIKTEFLIDGVWTDYSDRVRADGRVTITRGQGDQQSTLAPQTSDFTLNSRDGLFSNRNPNSPLYRKFGRNTQVRQSVRNAAGNLDAYFLKTYQLTGGGTWFSTADKAVLDIVGDIDVRFEITPASWRPSAPQCIGGKWTGAQRSWVVSLMPDGMIRWIWSNDGTALRLATSTLGFGSAQGRYALRVTLDVDNGAAGRTVTFYWATSLAGPWNLLSSATSATVTSVFSSSANLEVGGANGNGSSPFSNEIGFVGKVHGAEVYDGIAGTLRADFDPTTQAIGATTWSDGLGTPNTWTQNGTEGRVTSDRIRFVGEMSSLPQKWDLTGRDVYLPVRASGALRRLLQGGEVIHSAIYRNLIQSASVNGYWPMEAASGATKVDSTIKNNTSSEAGVSFTGGIPSGLAGSAGSMRLDSSTSRAYLTSPGRTSTGSASFIVYFKLTGLPASDKVLMSLAGNNTASRIDIKVGAGVYTFDVYNSAGTLLDTQSTLFGAGASPVNTWIGMNIVLTTSGANVNWEQLWHAVGSDDFYTPVPGGTTFAGSVGRLGSARLDARDDAAFVGAEFAHAQMTRAATYISTADFRDSSEGFTGEVAGRRLLRLAEEEGLEFDVFGNPDETEQVGAQAPARVIDLFQDAASVDGGVLSEARDIVAMQYVTRRQMGDTQQTTLDYDNSDLAATPEPIDDDRYLLNDITASRPSGSNARAVLEDGALSTLDPPDGVGRYEGTISKNAASDDQLQSLADFELHVRTWDEARVPNVVVGLHRSVFAADSFRTNAVLDLGIGSPLKITDLPAHMPPDDMQLISFGYTEVLEQKAWTITYNTAPYGPYRTYRVDSQSSSGDESRMSASTSSPTTLTSDITSATPSFAVLTPIAVPRWANSTAHAAEFPFDFVIGGERMTATAITVGFLSGANWSQTITATRSVNGIVKAHSAGSEVDIWDIAYLQLGA